MTTDDHIDRIAGRITLETQGRKGVMETAAILTTLVEEIAEIRAKLDAMDSRRTSKRQEECDDIDCMRTEPHGKH